MDCSSMQQVGVDQNWVPKDFCNSKATTAHAPLCQAFDSTSGAFAAEAAGLGSDVACRIKIAL